MGDHVSDWGVHGVEKQVQLIATTVQIHRLEEKLDIISGFVCSLGQLVQQSIEYRPIAADIVLNALVEEPGKSTHVWNRTASEFQPSAMQTHVEQSTREPLKVHDLRQEV